MGNIALLLPTFVTEQKLLAACFTRSGPLMEVHEKGKRSSSNFPCTDDQLEAYLRFLGIMIDHCTQIPCSDLKRYMRKVNAHVSIDICQRLMEGSFEVVGHL